MYTHSTTVLEVSDCKLSNITTVDIHEQSSTVINLATSATGSDILHTSNIAVSDISHNAHLTASDVETTDNASHMEQKSKVFNKQMHLALLER